MNPQAVISAPVALTTNGEEMLEVNTTSTAAWNKATTRMLPRLSL